MASEVAERARGDDVLGRVLTTVLLGKQVFCSALKEACGPGAHAELVGGLQPHARPAVEAAAILGVEGK